MATRVERSGLQLLSVRAHPIYPALLPVPVICFLGGLITDLAYLATANMMWLDFSSWLLLAGLVGGGFAGLLLIIEVVRAGRARSGTLMLHFALLLLAWIVEIFNSFIHARDGWTAVVPVGMTLSIIAAVLSLAAGWVWQAAARPFEGAAR